MTLTSYMRFKWPRSVAYAVSTSGSTCYTVYLAPKSIVQYLEAHKFMVFVLLLIFSCVNLFFFVYNAESVNIMRGSQAFSSSILEN